MKRFFFKNYIVITLMTLIFLGALSLGQFAYPNGPINLRAQGANEQNNQPSQNVFPNFVDGSYPATCGSSGDRLSCDDNIVETATSTRTTGGGGFNGWGGVNITTFNSAIANCSSINQVFLCYEFWGASSQHSCNVGVDANGGASWSNTGVTCSASAPGVTCINVTAGESWTCSSFFGSSGTRAVAKAQAQKTGGTGEQIWNFDVLYFNVSYAEIIEQKNVSLQSPLNGVLTSNTTLNFSYLPKINSGQFTSCSLWDNSSSGWSLKQSNTTAIINGTTNNFSRTYASDGYFIWNVQCCDSAGCKSSDSNFTLTIDATNPLISILSPLNQNYTAKYLLFNVSSNEALSVCRFSLDNWVNNYTMNTLNATHRGYINSSVNDGYYTSRFWCNDTADNINATMSVFFGVDANPPLINFVSPTISAGNYSSNVIYANVTASDSFSGLNTLTIRIYNNSVLLNQSSSSSTSPHFFNFTNLVDGTYYLNATANDSFGNSNQTPTRQILIDTIFPIVTITHPLNQTYGINITQFNYTVNEANLHSCWYSLDGGKTNTTHNCNGTIEEVFATTGLHNWTIYVNDTVGHESLAVVFFRVQGGVPILNLISPGQGQNYTTNVSLNYTVFDDFIDQCWYSINAGPLTFITCGQNVSVLNVSEGNNFLTLWTNDTDSNEVFENNSFFIDRINPLIFILNPENRTYANFERVFFNVSGGEDLSTCIFSWDSFSTNYSMQKLNSSSFGYINSSMNLGFFSTQFWCNDTYGNVNATQLRAFSVEVPSISITMLYPLAEINVTQDKFFNVTLNVSCVSSTCGNINVTLDPLASPTTGHVLRSQVVNEQNLQASQNIFTDAPAGTYPSSCDINGDRLGCDDNIFEQATSDRDLYGGINITTYNSTITRCASINEVILYYEFWGSSSQHSCNVGVDANGGASWTNIPVTCSASAPGIATLNVTLNESWACDNFFGSSGTRAVAKAQAIRTSGNGNQVWNFDVLYFNVSYTQAPINKGIISTTAGAVPFYTNQTSNPYTINLQEGQFQEVVFLVNATGEVDFYNFFAYANVTQDPSQSSISSNQVVWIRDFTAPQITFISPAQDYANSTENFIFLNVSVTERNEQNRTFYLWNSTTLVNSTNSTNKLSEINVSNLPNEIYKYSVEVWDSYGNVNSSINRTITLDALAPALNITYPADYANFTGHIIDRFSVNVTDLGIITCNLWGNWSGGWHLNQTKVMQKGIEDNFTAVNVTFNGIYSWGVSCSDGAGNSNTSTNRTFTAYNSLGIFNDSSLNITQSDIYGVGEITLYWQAVDNVQRYDVYKTSNLNQTFSYLGSTTDINYTDVLSNQSRRAFYRITAANPTSSSSSTSIPAKTIFYLERVNGVGTTNRLNFYLDADAISTANDSLNHFANLSTATLWNATTQSRVTCNSFSCPTGISCTPTNCDFLIKNGSSYEFNLNSSSPLKVNWSVVGVIYAPTNINVTKNSTNFGKNWIGLYANTSLVTGINLIQNISNADAVSGWNPTTQKSFGLVPNPFPWIPTPYLGNFNLVIEEGYEVSVNVSGNWSQA